MDWRGPTFPVAASNGSKGGVANDQVAFKLLVGASERVGGSAAAVDEGARAGLRHDGLVSGQRGGVSVGAAGAAVSMPSLMKV